MELVRERRIATWWGRTPWVQLWRALRRGRVVEPGCPPRDGGGPAGMREPRRPLPAPPSQSAATVPPRD